MNTRATGNLRVQCQRAAAFIELIFVVPLMLLFTFGLLYTGQLITQQYWVSSFAFETAMRGATSLTNEGIANMENQSTKMVTAIKTTMTFLDSPNPSGENPNSGFLTSREYLPPNSARPDFVKTTIAGVLPSFFNYFGGDTLVQATLTVPYLYNSSAAASETTAGAQNPAKPKGCDGATVDEGQERNVCLYVCNCVAAEATEAGILCADKTPQICYGNSSTPPNDGGGGIGDGGGDVDEIGGGTLLPPPGKDDELGGGLLPPGGGLIDGEFDTNT